MIGYMCATPYHVVAAITMANGMFVGHGSTLILMDHFGGAEQLADRARESGAFDKVLLYRNNNNSKTDKVKRLIHSFVPSKMMHDLANHTEFTNFVSFALDFIDLGYMIRCYRRRGIRCEFSYGDDGIGTYMDYTIYHPRKIAESIMKLNGTLSYLDEIETVYAYKPEYMVENKHLKAVKILQDNDTQVRRSEYIAKLWPDTVQTEIDGGILYFQQPNELYKTNEDEKIEKKALELSVDKLKCFAVVKLHPRSNEDEQWKPFQVLKTRVPFEVMLLQKQYNPVLMMTASSTALFSAYLLDGLPTASCKSIMLYHMMMHKDDQLNRSMDQVRDFINATQREPVIYSPSSMEELEEFLNPINK